MGLAHHRARSPPSLFRTEHLTEGKIAVDEDRATLVFSPYSGRVIKLLAKPGDHVDAGQPLFVVEAPDMVQAQNDFISAIANLNKTRSALDLAHDRRAAEQDASTTATRPAASRSSDSRRPSTRAAENDVRSAQTSLEVTRNRLRILGMKDDEITKFGETGDVSPQMTIYSPISGTVIQRKVGPGQYINTSSQNTSASDPTFVIGDLSTVWLVAYVRESEARNVQVGQALHFTVRRIPRSHVHRKHHLRRDLARFQHAALAGARDDRQLARLCFVPKCSPASPS